MDTKGGVGGWRGRQSVLVLSWLEEVVASSSPRQAFGPRSVLVLQLTRQA